MQTPGMLLFTGSASVTLGRATEYAKMAEERGFRNFLVTEAASDALALTQHLASETSRIQVGTAIFNIFLHPPLQAALHALTIDAIAPGRDATILSWKRIGRSANMKCRLILRPLKQGA